MTDHHRDVSLPQRNQVIEGQPCRQALVHDNVGGSFFLAVSGDGNDRQGYRVLQIQIDGNNAFGAAFEQQAPVLVEQVGIVVVDSGDKEVILLPDVVLDSRDYLPRISVAD